MSLVKITWIYWIYQDETRKAVTEYLLPWLKGNKNFNKNNKMEGFVVVELSIEVNCIKHFFSAWIIMEVFLVL